MNTTDEIENIANDFLLKPYHLYEEDTSSYEEIKFIYFSIHNKKHLIHDSIKNGHWLWKVIFVGSYVHKTPSSLGYGPLFIGHSKVSILEAIQDAKRKLEEMIKKGKIKEMENKLILMKE